VTSLYIALAFCVLGLLVIAWVVMRDPRFWVGLVGEVVKKLLPLLNTKPLPPGDPQEKGRPQTKPVTTGKIVIKKNPP
jgi:hypothetical protein